MICVYLIQSEQDGRYYCGISKDLSARIKVHNRGGLTVTARHRLWKLVFQKGYGSYAEARKHERWLKKKGRSYKAKLAG